MKNTFKKTAIAVLSLGLTTGTNAFAFSHSNLSRHAGNLKANHENYMLDRRASNGYSSNNSFHQHQNLLSVNNNIKTNGSQFIHATPPFNYNQQNSVIKTHATHVNNVRVVYTKNQPTHVVAKSSNKGQAVVHTTSTHYGVAKHNNVVINKPAYTTITTSHTTATHVDSPVVVHHNNHVVVTKPHHSVIVHSPAPVVVVPHPYYWNDHYYYNNDVNDVLAVALGLSLITNVAQFASANSHTTTNAMIYPTYPASSTYSVNTMSPYQKKISMI